MLSVAARIITGTTYFVLGLDVVRDAGGRPQIAAAGIRPRLAALASAGSLVPTTLAGHAFWTLDDPAQRKQQQIQFTKNLAMLGGLLYAVAGGPARRVAG
jgi:hypothetical protein